MAGSSFLGTPADRWSLATAVDALVQSARLAGVPGLIWTAGYLYPSLHVNIDLMRELFALAKQQSGLEEPGEGGSGLLVLLSGPDSIVSDLADTELFPGWMQVLVALPVFLVLVRLTVGLARICDPRLQEVRAGAKPSIIESGILTPADIAHKRPARLSSTWRAGRGLGTVAVGLWFVLIGLLFGAGLVLIGPVFLLVHLLNLVDVSPLVAGLLTLPMAVLLVYAVVLMVVNQLALHSLAHNKRGVSSALTHAWRLVRASPMSALRATAVDFVLTLSILALAHVLSSVLGTVQSIEWLAGLALFLLYGFAGVTRAAYWARAYRALGGMSAADQVPGL